MKLRYSPTSPYVRKVIVLAMERGLDKKIERLTTVTSPVAPDAALAKDNPLIKVPALTLKNGVTLFDSPVICEYLDSQHKGVKLFPAAGARRWKALRQQAVGDGLLDAALLVRYETAVRPESLRWKEWIEGQMRKISQTLDVLEREAADLAGGMTIGHITIGCALGYLDFRFADMGWRKSRPKLAAWYAKLAARKSMKATTPPT